ncbi:hypothetical protein [Ferruginibacter sp. HRS2-29]|uniref:hypothetical protein n=1 Tax=Ferruginibacter sp. HRS2-29 TaxID=2487334 RepID=UPI0020CCEDFE|nr:hypothetical protein [Ferruginibacter sp. HRS2-29]MCP9750915.1 hypothetical protein [Ferruginibacter sp. HRS2-29]
MKNMSFKKLAPHLIAVAVFLLVAAIFCKPGLESGVILKQSDVTGWHGMSHQSMTYKEIHGHPPLWVASMFSGMPAYQVYIEGAWSPVLFLDRVCQLWLPQPMNFFFLACISFYFLCICLRIRPLAAILGALAYAYCSFSPIIITAGHNTQMLALGYAPAVIGACVLIFDKKYLPGFSLAALFTSLQIAQGHQQISYYLFLVLLFMSVGYIVRAIKENQVAALAKSLGLMVLAGVLGFAMNAVTLFPTYDYAKESKRGGQLVIDGKTNPKDKVVNGKTTGLSKDYAFQWSYGQAETMTLMFPGVMSYGNHSAQRDGEVYQFPLLGEDAASTKFLQEKFNLGDQAASYASSSLYWGKQPFTNGPVYLGAIVCFLFITGMFLLDNKHKWWILAASIFGIVLAWGQNFAGFNYFMFDHFPLYNKFRVPTMALVIPQMLFPIVAALLMSKLGDDDIKDAWKKYRSALIATILVFGMALGFYASSSFNNENKTRTAKFNELNTAQDPAIDQKLYDLGDAYAQQRDNQVYEGMVANLKGAPPQEAQKMAREFVRALEKDRASYFLSDIMRSLIYVLIAAALLALYLKKKINITIATVSVTFVMLIDLLTFDSKYLNDKSYDSKETYEQQEFPETNADREILADKDPNFRVYDLSGGNPFENSKTSYYHKSIGGYHAAKLGIYDDLTSYHLNGQPNLGVLNMLNTKYVIQRQGNDVVASRNPGALGNVWFVKAIQYVDGPVAEMKALTGFNPKDTAVIDRTALKAPLSNNIRPADSTSTISMTQFDNDEITYQSNSNAAHFAVFSEIFYKDWNAYIDGNKVPIIKTDYVLRGLEVPAGKHTIAFKFEPKLFFLSKNISNIASWLIIALLAVCILAEVRKKRKEAEKK